VKIVLLAVALSGCSLIRMASFDQGEYELVNEVNTMAEIGDCSHDARIELWKTSLRLKNYSAGLLDNGPIADMAGSLASVTGELKSMENPSRAYCTYSMGIIKQAAADIQKAAGGKPR
jgi:hypothetical protein